MGYMIHSLAELPLQKGINLYIFLINGRFKDDLFEKLERHFPELARDIGEQSSIVRGLSEGFSTQVCRRYLGKSPNEMYASLPAVLITDARPEEISDTTTRLLVPLRHAASEFGSIETFFRALCDFCQTRDPAFLRRFEERSDWMQAANEYVDLKPNMFGFGINLNKLIQRLGAKTFEAS